MNSTRKWKRKIWICKDVSCEGEEGGEVLYIVVADLRSVVRGKGVRSLYKGHF